MTRNAKILIFLVRIKNKANLQYLAWSWVSLRCIIELDYTDSLYYLQINGYFEGKSFAQTILRWIVLRFLKPLTLEKTS